MYQKFSWWFPDADTHFAEMLSKNIKKGGGPVYQEPVRKASFLPCKKFDVALDIGANVGLWSRDLCNIFNHVIAFEPVEEFRACLEKNVIVDNLQIEACALGSTASQVNMIITPENTGHSHIDQSSMGQGTIELRTLDSMLLPVVDYIKIDCEGYEHEILLGAKQTIKQHRPIIVMEQKFHSDTGVVDVGQAAALLLSWGATPIQQVRNDCIFGWA